MEKFVINSKNENDVREKVKKMLTLNSDETILIKEIKKPFKFFFLTFDGKYEVTLIKKSELKKEKKESIKKEISKKENKNIKEPVKKEILKKEETIDTKIVNKIRSIFKEFLVKTDLNVIIKEISFKDNAYVIELGGEDVRYLIGEKGVVLSSLEYLMMSLNEFKNIKIYLDSNNYKEKREQILRDLANKTAKSVLKNGKKIKLNPMPSRERRIIHEEISKIAELETISMGIEPRRCLVIRLKNKK